MMKTQYIYSALIFTAILTAGCAKEEENTLDSSDSSAIELSSVSTDPMTKAVITGTEFTTTEAAAGIGLFLLDAEGKAYGENAGNVKYDFNSGKWTADKPLRAGGTSGMLYGYYPYSEGVTDIAAIPVASSIDGTDYLYASPVEVNSSNAKSVSLSLSHALARVSLSFKLDKSYEGSGALSSISLSGDCVAASGTLNAKTGSINAAAGAFSADGLNRTVDDETPTIVECLVVPVSIESGTPKLKFACTIDGKAYATTFTGDLAALAQGRQTTIELTVKNTSLTVDGSSIGAWGDGGTQTVTVGGDYKVTVKLADNIPANEIAFRAYIEEDKVKIEAMALDGNGLECIKDDNTALTPEFLNSHDFYTFTLADISNDVVVTIRYITVSFDLNNSNITDNFKPKPADMTKMAYSSTIPRTYAFAEKHSFRGWYRDANCTIPWNYSTDKVTNSITLYAKWVEDPTGTQINGHDFVKLGGYYWATQNVFSTGTGSNAPGNIDYGSYYEQKRALSAGKDWGGTWTLPSETQWQALIDNCKCEWKNNYDYNNITLNGYLVTGRDDTYESGHSIFLPAAGMYVNGNIVNKSSRGYYWSTNSGRMLTFSSIVIKMVDEGTDKAMSVRPVSE